RTDVATCRGHSCSTSAAGRLVGGIVESEPSAFLTAVHEIRRRIARGDVYQVNLARHWRATLSSSALTADIYRDLLRTNPAPYAGIATLDDWTLISSSPERLVRSRGGVVETRPIAGTRPTADDPALEEVERRDLLANPKERAEHIMLIDLERNDLGRVSQPGSVEVDEFMVVESYAHVHHIVSNVRGRLRPEVSPGELIAAMFPGGTITGCPKVRCMEIIGELEAAPRGPYTGSMGYLNRDGSCDLNILIRSFLVQDRALSFAAGSGIVADSDPARELDETRAKAKGLLLALGA
ncbi:MAG: aminodeoxychorismate synthase, component I, partial [Chromatiales bacterium]